MRNLLVTLEYPPHQGGVANYYYNLQKNWPEPNNIFVLSNNNNQLLSQRKLPFRWFKSIFSIYSSYRKNKANYLLIGQILPFGISALILKKLFNINYTIITHGMDFTYALRTKRKKFISTKILDNADKIISANSYTKNLIIDFKKDLKEKIAVVNPGVDFFEINNNNVKDLKTKYNLDNKYIIYSLGRLVKRKNFSQVIKAIDNFDEDFKSKIVYVISGSGEEKANLKKLAQNTSVNCIFTGRVDEKEKWSWFNICDIFVMPSKNIKGDFEGFGIVFLEANLCKKPVIGGLSGGMSDAIVVNETGFLVNPNDHDDISKKIARLLKDDDLRKSMGKKAYIRAKDDFNWNKQAKLFLKIINNK